jgi:sec-independent protein translocase protein TatA
MGGLSIWHWIIVAGVVFVLFGGKFKISDVMGDVAKGIKAFKKGMAEDDVAEAKEPPKPLQHQAGDPASDEKSSEARKV